jgi:surface protein
MKNTLILLFTVVFLSGCSKNESDIQEPVLFELEENILGKWYVSNNTTNPFEKEEVILHSIIFNSDKSFTINYSDGRLEGKYKVTSETELTLDNVGKLMNTSLTGNSLSSNLTLNNIVQKLVEGNKDSDFVEGNCSTFLECMDGKVFDGENGRIIKVNSNLEQVELSFFKYDFDPISSCCHHEGVFNGSSDLNQYDNIEVDIFEHTKDYISLYYETNCCDDFIIKYRINEFGNFISERLSESNNQYVMGNSYKETTQTVLDNLLQEYGNNQICESLDESTTFIEKQNGKYYKYSYEDFNWYLKFTDNPDEYLTLYHNVNETIYYDYINSSNNTFGINFMTPPVIDYNQTNGTFFDGSGYMWWEDYASPQFQVIFSLSETNCGQILYDHGNEPGINQYQNPKKYVLGFNYFYDNGIELGDDGNIIFEEISQSDFDNEVLQNILPPLYLDANGVTIKCRDDIDFGFVGEVDGVEYTVVDEDTLKQMINNGDDLSRVCTTKIRNGYRLFISRPDFNGDISKWDVSNVENMYEMFKGSTFNGDISKWDVSNVENMERMFLGNFYINQDLSSWNVEKVTNCSWFHLLHPSGVPVWTLPKPNFTNCDPN